MRILLAADGSEFAREAAIECGKLAATLETRIVKIITVADNFTPIAAEPFISPEEFLESVEREMRENSEQIILESEKIVRSYNETIEIELEIMVGSAKKIILLAAEKWRANLIVLGSHGYGFWARTLLGSVSDAVVHHAPCSVLVVRKG